VTQVPAARDEARALLERESTGVLCTLHGERDGWPFGSIVPYAVLPSGDPVVWLSHLAEHTHNLQADPRACLFVADRAAGEDPQAGARLSLLVRAERPGGDAEREAGAAYAERFPRSARMSAVHGFAFHVLRVETVRWIADFGSMGWIGREAWSARDIDPMALHSVAISEHMNRDHADSLALLATRFTGSRPTAARMTSIGRDGFEVEVEAGGERTRLRIPFPTPVTTPEEARRAMIALVAEARRGR
jgi:putative heme iron utilization protein